ncbi:hypothetical protein ACWDNI_32110 [Nocardia niigatensis]
MPRLAEQRRLPVTGLSFEYARDGWEARINLDGPDHLVPAADESGPESVYQTPEQIRTELLEFLSVGTTPELWAWYGAYDHVALAQLFGKMIELPACIPMRTNDIRQEQRRLGDPGLPYQGSGRHNALDDARHARVMHRALMSMS